MSGLAVAVRRLAHGAHLPLPAYATANSAGLDLQAAITAPLCLEPNSRLLIPTGIAIALPADHEAQVRPRSGLALRHGVTVLNSPGTIDADYRGEIQVLLINVGSESFTVEPGIRIAQMVFAPVARARWQEVSELPSSGRGTDGFGSTGSGAATSAGTSDRSE